MSKNSIWHMVNSYHDNTTLCGLAATVVFISNIHSYGSRWNSKEIKEKTEWCDVCVILAMTLEEAEK